MKLKIIISIITILIIGGGIWYYKKTNAQKDETSSNLQKASDYEKMADDTQTKDKLLFFKKQENSHEIISYNLETGENQTIFTDEDEDVKITKIGSYAYLSQEILCIMGENPGKLTIIKLDGSGTKSNLIDSFSIPDVMALSPDGRAIAYFYNHNLYQMARDGSNKRKIFQTEDQINQIAWDQNAQNLAIVENKENEKSIIKIINLESLKQADIYTTSEQILSLFWHENGLLIFNEGIDQKIQTGIVYSIKQNGYDKKMILKTKKDFPYSSVISSDFIDTAIILKSYPDKFDENLDGEISLIQVGSENINKIGSGNLILGWMP